MSINDLSFCDHGYTKIKICPSCLREKDDQIDSLKSLLRSAHEIIKVLEYKSMDQDGLMCECYFCRDDVYTQHHLADCLVGKFLTAYSSLTSSKSGMGAQDD